MSLKNHLRIGQASLEYFILLAVIAVLTILSFSAFFPSVRQTLQGQGGFFQQAAERITR